MSRCLPWLALAACGTAPGATAVAAGDDDALALRSHTAAMVEPPPAAVVAARPYETAPLPIAPAANLIAATPQGEITIAAPIDGGYVVSADRAGGVRLWPALDGTREPIVIRARHASQIATLRDGDAIVIAVVDPLGQLELVRVSADGTPLDRVAVAVPRPIVELVASAHAIVALRDDHVLAVFDPRGAIRGELEPDPGERIARLVASNDRVLAMLAPRGTKRTGRWLVLGEQVGWGARTAKLVCIDDDIYLAPDGKTLLAMPDLTTIALIDLARGTPTVLLKGENDPREVHALGFRGAGRAVFESDGKGLETVGNTTVETTRQFGARWLPIGVAAVAGYLVVQRGDAPPKFLGYRVGRLADLVPVTDGWLATDNTSLVHLDAHLRGDGDPPVPFLDEGDYRNAVTLIDDRHIVIAHDQASWLYELGAETATEIGKAIYAGTFERSTGLVFVPGSQRVMHWNSHTHAFDPEPVDLGADEFATQMLYNPAGNNGLIAATVAEALDETRPGERVAVIRRREVTALAPHERHRDVTFPVSVDDIFDHHSGPNLSQYLPARVEWAASSDGSLIAELAAGRITLHDRDGNVRWVRTADGARGLAWNRADELVIYGEGAALVDLDTGESRERQCGWRFGLWDKPPGTFGVAQLCEAP